MASSNSKRPRLGERTTLACLYCKQKKLKCDGHSPKCQNCAKTARECLVEDPATGLLRPRNYTQSLETRVAFLEELLQKLRPDVAVDHLHPVTTRGLDRSMLDVIQNEHGIGPSLLTKDSTQPPPIALTDSASPQDGAIGSTTSNEGQEGGNNLASDVALLALNATGREPHYFGPSSALSFARIAGSVFKLNRAQDSSQADQEIDEATDHNQRRRRRVDFPSPSAALRISAAYFANIHPQYPFLHEPAFRRWEGECASAERNGSLDSASATALFFTTMASSSRHLGENP